jgi:hypothetical protein
MIFRGSIGGLISFLHSHNACSVVEVDCVAFVTCELVKFLAFVGQKEVGVDASPFKTG